MTVKSLVSKKTIYVVVATAAIIIVIGAALSLYLQKPNSTTPKAAIIDQLSSSYLTQPIPNQTFVNATTTLLHEYFSEVDYYSNNATVDNYEKLGSEGYKLIIWRAHSAIDPSGYIAISTTENNATSDYTSLYMANKLTLCYIEGDPTFYWAITPKFISETMNGRFDDTVIILMSCNGLEPGYTQTAEALQEKGARAVISWNNWIEAPNNDGATAMLLDYLINQNNTIQQAVSKIPQQQSPLGPSQMLFFPTNNETANYRIPNYNENTTISEALTSGTPNSQNIDAEGRNRTDHELQVDSAKLQDVSIALKLSETAGYEEFRQKD